jgi:hypothetical protein
MLSTTASPFITFSCKGKSEGVLSNVTKKYNIVRDIDIVHAFEVVVWKLSRYFWVDKVRSGGGRILFDRIIYEIIGWFIGTSRE